MPLPHPMLEIVIAILQRRLSDQIAEIVAELWLELMTPLNTLQGTSCWAKHTSCIILSDAQESPRSYDCPMYVWWDQSTENGVT